MRYARFSWIWGVSLGCFAAIGCQSSGDDGPADGSGGASGVGAGAETPDAGGDDRSQRGPGDAAAETAGEDGRQQPDEGELPVVDAGGQAQSADAATTLDAGGDGEDDAGSEADGGGVGFCEIGTAGCGCSASFPCQDEGYACVEGVCIQCPTGSQGCPCGEGGACDGALTCQNPDPSCSFNCEPSTCEP